MALPSLLGQLVERKLNDYCQNKVPEQFKDQIRLYFKIRGNHVTLVEARPRFLNPSEWADRKVAQFRYDREEKNWTLFFADRNGTWYPYFESDPSQNIDDLINEVEEDSTGIFWG